MNTIPSTFKNSLPPYTAVGGTERRAATGLSAVILNRGGKFSRSVLFEELGKAGFDYVISMESASSRYDLESLTQSFPFVRFILLKEAVSPGEEINLAAAELAGPFFFVLRGDVKILRSGGAARMAERLLASEEDCESGGGEGGGRRLCTVPLVQDSRAEAMPTLVSPALVPETRAVYSIKTLRFVPSGEGELSLYPFDGMGIYDRARFTRLGGFDSTIKSFYWQLMDFGFRAALWGEEIAATKLVKLSCEGEMPQEDSTVGESCMKFILKNLAPVFRGDYAHIPLGRFPAYFRRRGSLLEAWREFLEVREWVKTNRYRFRSDARTVTERWRGGAGISASSPEECGAEEKESSGGEQK